MNDVSNNGVKNDLESNKSTQQSSVKNEEVSDKQDEGSVESGADAVEEAGAESPQEVELEKIDSSALDDALDKISALEEQVLREKAEIQNVRKRVQRDVENARKFALEKFVAELLPVIDNLERALEASEDADAVREGVELTLKSLLAALNKFNVEQINPVGEPFDANFHQAMTMVPNPDMEPNTIMDVMQKGYSLNQRLVRPAMVVVSKAP